MWRTPRGCFRPSIEIPKGGAARGREAQNEKIHLHMQMDFFILVDLIGFEPTTPTMRKVI